MTALKLFRLIPIFILILCSGLTVADVPDVDTNDHALRISSELSYIDIGPQLASLRDEKHAFSIERLLEEDNVGWHAPYGTTPNLGVDPAVFWFKSSLKFNGVATNNYLLEIAYPALDFVDVYFVHSDSQSKQIIAAHHTGDHLAYDKRPINHRNFVFPIPLSAEADSVDIYIRIQTEGAVQLPTSIWQQQLFWEQDQMQLMGHTFFIAILITVALYNLMLYLSMRDTTYLLYVCYIICLTLTLTGLRGLNYQLFVPEWPAINERLLLVAVGLAIFFACLFARKFMALPKTRLQLDKLVLAIAFAALLQAVAGTFMPYAPTLKFGIILTGFACLVLLIVGLVQWLNGVKVARFFTLAWFVYLVGQFTLSLSKFGLIPRTALVEHGPEIGASLEVILLSFALADRMNQNRIKRHEAQQQALIHEKAARQAKEHALAVQNQANEELESRVDARTTELQQTLKQLSVVNEKLHHLSNLDGLTQVSNRRAYDQTLNREWRRCARENAELSLILLDVDFFKQVNDQHGHQAGDECLKFIAHILMSSVRRPGDFVARYGGEEFVVVMPNTSRDGAAVIAERIRSRIEAENLVIEGQTIALTASIGLAVTIPNHDLSEAKLTEFADQALYRAKDEGRNRVVQAPELPAH